MSDSIQDWVARLVACLKARDRAGVNAAAEKLLDRDAALGPQWKTIATALSHNGELGLARRAIDLYARQGGSSPDKGFARAAFLAQIGALADTVAALDELPPGYPDPASNAHLRGTIALIGGDTATAEQWLRKAIEARPTAGPAWLALSETIDIAGDPSLQRLIERHWPSVAIPADRAPYAYALGRVRHGRKDYQQAFAAFSAGASIKLKELRLPDEAQLAQWSMDWPDALIDRSARRIDVDHGRLIFVTGLPRSGSTLTEQILVSHPDVHDGSELNLVRLLVQEIGGTDPAHFERWLDAGNDPNRLTALYLRLVAERFGPEGRIVDKTLELSKCAGLLHALFPNAPILWTRRDPIDTGWSAFRSFFANHVGWSWDLGATGQRLATEDRMWTHWIERDRGQIATVNFTDLVTEPGQAIQAIAAAAGLDFQEAMLEPGKTERAVATASTSQVRQSINRKGLGVAEPYREWLGPMINAYKA